MFEVRVVLGACKLTSSCLFATVPQPDPNQPKPEGRQMMPVKGEPLGVICNWPPALESALQRWGSTQAKCPCLTGLDVSGKPVYTLTYGGSPLGVVFLLIFLSCTCLIYLIEPCVPSGAVAKHFHLLE